MKLSWDLPRAQRALRTNVVSLPLSLQELSAGGQYGWGLLQDQQLILIARILMVANEPILSYLDVSQMFATTL